MKHELYARDLAESCRLHGHFVPLYQKKPIIDWDRIYQA